MALTELPAAPERITLLLTLLGLLTFGDLGGLLVVDLRLGLLAFGKIPGICPRNRCCPH